MVNLILVIFVMCTIGAQLTEFRVGPLSLGAIVTMLIPALLAVIILLRFKVNRDIIKFTLPLMFLCILSLFWDLGHVINGTWRLHNITVILLGFLISIIFASQSVPKNFWRKAKFIDDLLSGLRLVAYLYIFILVYFSLTRSSAPAFVQLSTLFFPLLLLDFFIDRRKFSLLLALVVLLSTALLGARIVLFAEIVVSLFSIFIFVKGRYFQKLLILGLVALVTTWFLTTSRFQDRMFGGDVGLNIAGYTINSSGRAAQWEIIFNSIEDHHFLGTGYSIPREMFGMARWDHPHNEYLRLLHQFGILGLFLWLWNILIWFARTWGVYSHFSLTARADSYSKSSTNLSGVSGLYLIGVSIVMITDNSLAYSYVMYPLGLLLGVSLTQGLSNNLISDAGIPKYSQNSEPNGFGNELFE